MKTTKPKVLKKTQQNQNQPLFPSSTLFREVTAQDTNSNSLLPSKNMYLSISSIILQSRGIQVPKSGTGSLTKQSRSLCHKRTKGPVPLHCATPCISPVHFLASLTTRLHKEHLVTTSRTNLSACRTGRAPAPGGIQPVGAVISTQSTHLGGGRPAAGSLQNRVALLGRTDQNTQVIMPQQLHYHRALCQAAQAELVA